MSKKNKFYAVKKGRIPGIYNTWKECFDQIDKYPGNLYRSFDTFEEATTFLNTEVANTGNKEALDNSDVNKILEESDSLTVNAFTDGSFSKEEKKYSFGSVILYNNKKISFFKSFIDQEGTSHQNFTGEIKGALECISWAIDNNFKRINLFYDYIGIEKFITGEFKKPTNNISREYIDSVNIFKTKIEIHFYKVKAHSGIVQNEEADALAKAALTSTDFQTKKDGSVTVSGITLENWIETIKTLNTNLEDENDKLNYTVDRVSETVLMLRISQNTNKVTIRIYHNIKSYVQGKISPLLENLISYSATHLKNTDSFVSYLNRFHAITILQEEIYQLYEEKYPNVVRDKLDAKLQIIYDSSLYHYLLTSNMPDYRSLLTHIFIVMESLLHHILSSLGNKTNKNNRNNFAFFNKNHTTNLYEYGKKNNISNEKLSTLNELYNYYYYQRHNLSHWSLNSFDSAMLTNLTKTKELMDKGYLIIDKCHYLFY